MGSCELLKEKGTKNCQDDKYHIICHDTVKDQILVRVIFSEIVTDKILANITCMHTYTFVRILLVDQILAILIKNRQSPKFTPHQYFILYGTVFMLLSYF